MITFIWDIVIGRIIIFINIIIILFFITCSLNPFLDIDSILGAGFFGISFPFAFLGLIICFFLDFIFKPRWAIIIIIVLILNWKQIIILIPLNLNFQKFNIEKKSQNSLRILNWNVRRFLPNNVTNIYKSKFSSEHLNLITKYNPDVICFQEYLFKERGSDSLSKITKILNLYGYKYFLFSSDYYIDENFESGNIIFSKFPILSKQITKFESIDAGYESFMYLDLKLNENQKIRVYTTHLESYGLKDEEYKELKIIKEQKDKKFEAVKDIFSKMRNIFLIRKQQTNLIKSNINNISYDFIFCGDFNDVPHSYTYFTIKENLQDAFIEKGFGIGNTYKKLLPTLRIDYILCTKKLKVNQYERIETELSDHYPIIADIEYKNKNNIQ